MDAENFLEAEVGVAVAATAVLLSPRVRGWLRKGAVYGVAGVLMAADAVTAGARGVSRGASGMAAAMTGDAAEDAGTSDEGNEAPKAAEGEAA